MTWNVRAHRALCLAPGMEFPAVRCLGQLVSLCVSLTQGAGLGFWALSAWRALGVSRLLCNLSAPPDTTHPLRWKGELTWVWILEPESRQRWKVNNQSRNPLRMIFRDRTWEDGWVKGLVLRSSGYMLSIVEAVLPYTGWMGLYKERAECKNQGWNLVLLLPWRLIGRLTSLNLINKSFPNHSYLLDFCKVFMRWCLWKYHNTA